MPKSAQIVAVEGRRLRLTNLDKVMYPETGTTKGEVIAYYSAIAPRILPGLAGRPVTRKRWVEGVGTADAPEPSFFAKQIEPGTPDWVARRAIDHSGGAKDYPLIEDLPTLVWLAQVASIELHVPQWRFAADGTRKNPDRLVLDLDPGPGADLAQCAEIARLARAILADIGLDPVPVTSGSKGIHLYAPLDGDQTSDAASAIAKELARAIETDHPDLATSTMAKAVRGGKVFIDWSQNNGAKTTIAPYSLRGRSRPTVAAPRRWEELDDADLAHLDLDEVLARTEPDGFSDFAPADAGPAVDPVRASIRAAGDSPTASASASASAATLSAHSAPPRPMLAERGTPALARALGSPAWVEVKWDGIRALGTWTDGRMRLHARSGIEITDRYPELTADGAPHFRVRDAVVDGEVVAFDDSGRPSFSRLQNRMHLTRAREIEREVVRTPIVYQVFDLLHLDGRDLTRMPLRERRTLLEELITDAQAPIAVPPVLDDVDSALTASRELGLEGIVVKDARSPYRPGTRSPSWLKITHTRTQEVVIAGVRPGRGDRAGSIGSLLLAVPDGASLRYVGRVGTGFTERALAQLAERLGALGTATRGIEGVPDEDAKDAIWVRPELVAEVEFASWTPGGSLRHARWRGLRADKTVADITLD
ncbi:MAG: non-homologous end-joining DNA ligase [Actinomycetota bacterium]